MNLWIEDPHLVFADTDFISSFLRVNEFDFLIECFGEFFRVPREVRAELKMMKINPRFKSFWERFREFENENPEKIIEIEVGSEKERLFNFIKNGDFSGQIMGTGESAALTHAMVENGSIASNNLRDVKKFCERQNILVICSEHILVYGCLQGIVEKEATEKIWEDMKKVQTLPREDFSKILKRHSDSMLSSLKKRDYRS